MAKPEQADWREKCARRLTATLARKPQKGKIAAYLSTLPKRSVIVVSPEEFGMSVARSTQQKRGKRRPKRKDRLRPKATRKFYNPTPHVNDGG